MKRNPKKNAYYKRIFAVSVFVYLAIVIVYRHLYAFLVDIFFIQILINIISLKIHSIRERKKTFFSPDFTASLNLRRLLLPHINCVISIAVMFNATHTHSPLYALDFVQPINIVINHLVGAGYLQTMLAGQMRTQHRWQRERRMLGIARARIRGALAEGGNLAQLGAFRRHGNVMDGAETEIDSAAWHPVRIVDYLHFVDDLVAGQVEDADDHHVDRLVSAYSPPDTLNCRCGEKTHCLV